MKTRPWPIVIVGLVHILSPLVDACLNAWLSRVGVPTYLRLIWNQEPWYSLADSFLGLPLAGVAIILMRQWSYPLFLSLMGWAMYSSFLNWRAHPQTVSMGTFTAVVATNIAVVSYFLLPAVRNAYLNRKLRWWEHAPRFDVDLPATYEVLDFEDSSSDEPVQQQAKTCRIINLSEGGAFVRTTGSIPEGHPIQLTFTLFNREFQLRGRTVHRRLSDLRGYGIEFQFTQDEAGRALARQVKLLARGLRMMGVQARSVANPWPSDFIARLKDAIRTGKGLVPEIPAATRIADAGSVASLKPEKKKKKKNRKGSRSSERPAA